MLTFTINTLLLIEHTEVVVYFSILYGCNLVVAVIAIVHTLNTQWCNLVPFLAFLTRPAGCSSPSASALVLYSAVVPSVCGIRAILSLALPQRSWRGVTQLLCHHRLAPLGLICALVEAHGLHLHVKSMSNLFQSHDVDGHGLPVDTTGELPQA